MQAKKALAGRAVGLLPLFGLLACRPAGPGSALAPTDSAGVATPQQSPQDGRPDLPSGAAAPTRPLTVWTVSALEASSEEAPSFRRSLAAAALELEAGAPGLEIVTKPAYGAAGIEAFLISSARVAPERLPDACILPLEALARLQALGLLQPLRDEQLAARASEAFPFATRLTGPAEAPWGLPLAVDVLHAIVRDAPVPGRWGEPAASPLVLPLGGGAAAPELAALLSLYAAQGGDLAGLDRPDPGMVRGSFEALAEGLADGTLALPAEGRTPRAAWNQFVSAEAPAAVVSGGTIVARQRAFPGLRWGPLPGPRGPAPAVAWGWALAITTADPVRAGLVAKLLQQVSSPEKAADVLAAGLLPPQREAWAERVTDGLDEAPDPAYLDFLAAQLQAAAPLEALGARAASWAAAGQALADGSGAAAALQALETPSAP